MSRSLALVALPLLLVVGPLAACTESTRIPPAEPPAATEPLFASDEEALAAATAAYEEYLAVSNEAASALPFDLSSLEPLVTSEYLLRETESLNRLEEQGWLIAGQSSVEQTRLQQWYVDNEVGHVVVMYACIDVSQARVIDRDGVDVTPIDRSNQVSLEVEFVEGENRVLLLNRSDSWSGDPVC